MGWLIILLVVIVLAWMVHSWVIVHALSVLTPSGNWEVSGYGWHGIWQIVLPVGTASLIIGLLLAGELNQVIEAWLSKSKNSERKQLDEEWEALRVAKIDQDRQARDSHRKEVEIDRKARKEAEEDASKSNQLAEEKARLAARLQGRLKGSQQKAARIKKALLTRGDAPKPGTV